MKALPEKVRLCECWTRDGIQGEATFIPTARKIEMINGMIDAGFKRIEVTSFAHPKLLPQFSDSLEVLRGIRRPPDVTFISVIPNEKALDRLLTICDQGYGVQEITAILSASEDHLLANLERSFSKVMPSLSAIVKRARAAGLKVIGCIGTAFGCPLAGEVSLEGVTELTDWYLTQGATSIMLGDTTGEANPLQVSEVYGRMRETFPSVDFIGHFHDTRGMGLANTFAALQEGIVYHDGAFGGIGGQPATRRPKYHQGFSGNTCTEDLVVMMEEMGIDTGLDVDAVLDLARRAEAVCGRELRGHVTRSGTVRHRSRAVLTPGDLRQGREIRPALFHFGEAGGMAPELLLPVRVMIHALEKSCPLPEGLKLDASGVTVHGQLEEGAIIITRFDILETSVNGAVLRVLSQKANGDPYLEGTVDVIFTR